MRTKNINMMQEELEQKERGESESMDVCKRDKEKAWGVRVSAQRTEREGGEQKERVRK